MRIVQLQLILLFFILFVSGCIPDNKYNKNIKPASVQEMRASTKWASIREKNIPDLKRGQTVEIQNYYTKQEVEQHGIASSSIVKKYVEIGTDAYDIDLRQFTKTAMELLSKALKHRDIENVNSGLKQVKLRAHSAEYNQGAFSASIEVSITAELGNSKSITASGKRDTTLNMDAAASAALSYAISKILNHPDFIQYINQ